MDDNRTSMQYQVVRIGMMEYRSHMDEKDFYSLSRKFTYYWLKDSPNF